MSPPDQQNIRICLLPLATPPLRSSLSSNHAAGGGAASADDQGPPTRPYAPPPVVQVEELRQQIRMLQAVGYNTVDDDDDDNDEAGAEGGGGGGVRGRGGSGKAGWGGGGNGVSGGGGGSMEAALLQKNRHLEHELTMARLKGVDAKAELDAALARLGDLEGQVCEKKWADGEMRGERWDAGWAPQGISLLLSIFLCHPVGTLSLIEPPCFAVPQVSEQQRLIDRLEEDLMASRSGRGSHGGAAAAGGGGKGAAGSGPSSSKLSGLLGGARASSTAAGGDGGDEDSHEQDSSMLRVLCSQRDRCGLCVVWRSLFSYAGVVIVEGGGTVYIAVVSC